jgi:hypothetical protein
VQGSDHMAISLVPFEKIARTGKVGALHPSRERHAHSSRGMRRLLQFSQPEGGLGLRMRGLTQSLCQSACCIIPESPPFGKTIEGRAVKRSM